MEKMKNNKNLTKIGHMKKFRQFWRNIQKINEKDETLRKKLVKKIEGKIQKRVQIKNKLRGRSKKLKKNWKQLKEQGDSANTCRIIWNNMKNKKN